MLTDLTERFRYVIVDSPALGAVSDALSLVPEVSGSSWSGPRKDDPRRGAGTAKQFALLDESRSA